MFTPEKADEIEAHLKRAPELERYDRMEDGQEFTLFFRFDATSITPPIKFAMLIADTFDIDFPGRVIRLYLYTDDSV